MGISRDRRHKRRATGGKRKIHVKKRKSELGRPPAMTKIGQKRIHMVRVRGGNLKRRAMRLDSGNFSMGTEVCTRKTRILDVVYNASNNELVRTKTLVKNAIVLIDASPFRQYFFEQYGVLLGGRKPTDPETTEASDRRKQKQEANKSSLDVDQSFGDQFKSGRLLACISSRPGQSGRADGYLLENQELQFYLKKLKKKKGSS